jgi:hypothetical protein
MKISLKPIVFIVNAICIFLLAVNLNLHNIFHLSAKELVLFLIFPIALFSGCLLMFMYYLTGAVICLISLILYYVIHYVLNRYLPQGSQNILFLIAPLLAILDRLLVPADKK